MSLYVPKNQASMLKGSSLLYITIYTKLKPSHFTMLTLSDKLAIAVCINKLCKNEQFNLLMAFVDFLIDLM